MQLFHVSEQGGIERFEPRVPPGQAATARPVVWAVDAAHLVNYLVPRDCPRVCFRAASGTTAADRVRFLGSFAGPVVAIEAAWFARASATPLWLYEFSSAGFEPNDLNAGYYVSPVAAIATRRRQVEQPLAELVAAGAELRVVHSVRQLADAVAASSLSFSCIRMRGARP